MKKIAFTSAAVAMMIASAPAFAADTDSDSFDINASVAKTCTMENLNDVALGTVGINTTSGSTALFINGGSTGATNNAYVSCNDTNSMTITSANNGRLVNTTPPSGTADAGFKNTINYSLAASNYLNGLVQPGFRRSLLFGLISVGNGTPRGAIHRQVHFNVLVDPFNNGDARPTAGLYQDTVTVTVSTT
jgi:hypothetical protein